MDQILGMFVLLSLVVPEVHGTSIDSERGVRNLKVVPQHIRVGATYHGTTVRVSANTPPCDGVVVVLEGEEEDLALNRKGRVAGLWLNVANLTVRGAPRVYLIAHSSRLDDLCANRKRLELGLGFDALADRIEFESDKPLTGKEFEQFLRMMQYRDTYVADVPIELEDVGVASRRASTIFPIPSCVSPGNYMVSLYCFEDGEPVGQATARLSIEAVGLPRQMTRLAFGHPAAYGILAVAVALVAGAAMGLIFNVRWRRR